MLGLGVRSQSAEPPSSAASLRPASALGDLFLPLPYLLGCGGDPRLGIDPASGVNQYGCRPVPCPGTLGFSSSTATSISEQAYDRAGAARQSLMRSAIAVGLDEAFEARGRVQNCRRSLGLPIKPEADPPIPRAGITSAPSPRPEFRFARASPWSGWLIPSAVLRCPCSIRLALSVRKSKRI